MADLHWTRARFQPLRPVSARRMLAAFLVAPLLWVAALASVSWLVDRSDAIELGLLIAAASFLLGLAALSLLRAARRREERRYVRGR